MRRLEVRSGLEGAADVPGEALDLLEARPEALRRNQVRDPAVTDPCSATERGVRPAADPDRWPARLRRLRLEHDVGEPREATFERRGRRPPERPADGDALLHPRAAFPVGNAARLELLRELAADADAEDDATSRQDVEGRDQFRGDGRVPKSQEVHARADPDVPGERCQVAE